MRRAILTAALLAVSNFLAAQSPAGVPQPEPTRAQVREAAAMPFRNPTLPVSKRVDDLISRLTLEEKVSQTIDRAPAIPRLDIPAYNWWNEGLHGIARSGYATMFPQAIGNAATWDEPLVHSIGAVVSSEARAKYNDAIRHNNRDRYYGLTIWSPNINIFRDPRWGRGQETYGEDPFLTARLGAAFIQGIQGDNPKYLRAIATPKHYAVHSGPESTRHEADVDPSAHDLWDTYLPAFRAAITEGKADSIMCSYNAVDKDPACASKMLLGDILRGDWRFPGYVVSDCDAIDDFSQPHGHHYSADHAHGSAAGVIAGTDLDCGRSYLALVDAVHQGLISEAQIDTSVKRLFAARMKLGMFDPAAQVAYASLPMSVVNSPANDALALRAARESMVLLKNDDRFLPLDPARKQTIAVVGPLAASRIALEGNYNGTPLHPILPIDGIEKEFGFLHVLYAQGAPYVEGGDVLVPRTMLRAAGDSTVQGLQGEYFAHPSFDGVAEMIRLDREIDFDWANANPVPSLAGDPQAQSFAVRWTGAIVPPAAGKLDFQVRLPFCYPCNGNVKFEITVDGQPVQPTPPSEQGATRLPPSGRNFGGVQRFSIPFADARPHALRIEYVQSARIMGSGISLEWTPDADQLRDQAVAAAQKADVVVAFVGLTARLEGEEMRVNAPGFSGGDRTSIDLPAAQQQMLGAIAKTGKPIVVVLLNGSALAVNWANENARAILEAWYPGESGGQAVAETLTGANNPSGRLPITFYAGTDQLPAFDNYSMANRTYRYFSGHPLFAFGDGLSYATFRYSHLRLSTSTLHAGDPLTVEADLTNIGKLAGDEVAELYLTSPHSDISPRLALAGFERIHLAPGAARHLVFHLDARTLSQVDDKGERAVTPGVFRISIGGSQPEGDAASTVISKEFTIAGSYAISR